MRVARIGFTALKGARHVEHPAVELTATGPVGDRIFCLVDPARSRVLRTVEHPALVGTVATWDSKILTVDLPDGRCEAKPVPSGNQMGVDYWGRTTEVEVVEGPWAAAFSDLLGRGVVLARVRPGGVVYGASVTLVTTSSARLLAKRVGAPVDSARFRATFVMETDDHQPHVEDSWAGRTLRIGLARLLVRGLVPRCAVIDLDPHTGRRNANALATLAGYRRTGREIHYGIDAVVVTPGTVQTGDPVSVGEHALHGLPPSSVRRSTYFRSG